MATVFLEPGGDSTFSITTHSSGGLWGFVVSAPVLATDFVHGNHVKSIQYRVGGSQGDQVGTPNGTLSDTGSRLSDYFYFNAMPSANAFFMDIRSVGGRVFGLKLTHGGVMFAADANGAQIGTNGPTLSTGQWYRVSIAYTITSTTVNRIEVFVDGVSAISMTDITLTTTGTTMVYVGNNQANDTFDIRSSDHYVDDSSSLLDTGNIWVTAKRPNANGTTNGFSTQIGAGGSGYGSGHSPQVNERPTSTTNGWAMIGVGSAVTEEYNIEAKNTGDIDISAASIIDWLGWVTVKSLVAETIQVVLDGVSNSTTTTTSIALQTKVKGSLTYPSGTGADIGIITDTSLTTVSLYECGVVVAYIPSITLSVFDSVTVSEGLQIAYSLPSPIVDSVTVSESIQIRSFLLPFVTDSITITENIATKGVSSVNLSDSVTVSESISFAIPFLSVVVFESVSIDEFFNSSANRAFEDFELVTISESTTIFIPTLFPLIFDSITVSESISLRIPLPVNLFDSVTITEGISMSGVSTISTSDLVVVTESNASHSANNISVYDSIAVSDTPGMDPVLRRGRLFPNVPRGSASSSQGFSAGGNAS